MLDEISIKQLHAGNNLVFKQIFDRYYLSLCSFAHRYVKDDEVVDDLVQEAFVAIWERKECFHVMLAIKSFLYINVKNACLNHLKHLQVRYKNEEELSSYLLDDEDHKYILEDEVHARIYKAIQKLSEQSRLIVLLTMEGLSNQDIAERLNISVNSVKTVKLRSYRILRDDLKDLKDIKFILLILLFA